MFALLKALRREKFAGSLHGQVLCNQGSGGVRIDGSGKEIACPYLHSSSTPSARRASKVSLAVCLFSITTDSVISNFKLRGVSFVSSRRPVICSIKSGCVNCCTN